jgi:hypothetical protein
MTAPGIAVSATERATLTADIASFRRSLVRLFEVVDLEDAETVDFGGATDSGATERAVVEPTAEGAVVGRDCWGGLYTASMLLPSKSMTAAEKYPGLESRSFGSP